MPQTNPASLANLRPYPLVHGAPPNNTGKKYKPSFKTVLKKISEIPGGDINISDTEKLTLGLEAHAWYKLLMDARNDNDFDLSERTRALTAFSDRLHGKPEQPIKQSGTLDINATITVEKLDAEAAIIQDRLKRYAEGKLTEEQYEREMRGEVQEAVFEDVSTCTNVHVESESESETA